MNTLFPQIRIVCVRPLYGGNVGSICRAMRNCGLSQLVLVDPHPDMDPVETRKMAMHALPVYENREEATSLEEAVGDCRAVAMTSGVDGFYRGHALSPAEAAPRLLEAATQGPVAVVFGPEDKGLGLEEQKQATHLIRIPSYAEYPSLNLSQAVLLVSHELFKASESYEAPVSDSPPATHAFRERMFTAWDQTCSDIRFCPPEKQEHMMRGIRRAFSRGELSENDVKILLGLARQASWAAKNGPGDNG